MTIVTIVMIIKMMMMRCYCWLQSRNDAPAVGHDLWLRRRRVDIIIIIGEDDVSNDDDDDGDGGDDDDGDDDDGHDGDEDL